jgi:hypothetical protein
MTYEQTQEKEWEELYDQLSEILSCYGVSNPFGDGDFWLIDDNYSSPQHKVCVARLQTLCFATDPTH